MINVLVCGGRDFRDPRFVFDTLDRLHAEHEFGLLVHGGARGVDMFAGQWAMRIGVHVHSHHTALDHLDEAASSARYEDIFDKIKPGLVVAFSLEADTRKVIERANDSGIPVVEPLRSHLGS